jgi:hypothetical protein
MANQPINKKVINYYASFYDVSKELNHKQFYEFNSAIFSVMFYERHIDDITFDDKLLSIAWLSTKHSLQASIDGFCSKNQIDYEHTLSKGLSKGLDKGLTNNVKDNDKEKDKDKDKENNNIEAFLPNAASINVAFLTYPNCDVDALVIDFKDQARNRAKPFKDLQSGFRNYVRKGWVKPATKQKTELSYSEIGQILKQERESLEDGKVPSGQIMNLTNKMRIM